MKKAPTKNIVIILLLVVIIIGVIVIAINLSNKKNEVNTCKKQTLLWAVNSKIYNETKFAVLFGGKNNYEGGDIVLVKPGPESVGYYNIGYVLTIGDGCMNNTNGYVLGRGALNESEQAIRINNTAQQNTASNQLCLTLINTDTKPVFVVMAMYECR